MTAPVTLKFGKFKVEIGDGGTPETFSAPCGFTAKSFSRTKALNEVVIPDCDDPDLPAAVARDVASSSWSVTGEGVLPAASVATWDAMFASSTSRNVRITMEWAAPTGTIVYTGAAHLETYEITANLGNRVVVNISLQGDGALTRSPALS